MQVLILDYRGQWRGSRELFVLDRYQNSRFMTSADGRGGGRALGCGHIIGIILISREKRKGL
jgi:hypothetical protein